MEERKNLVTLKGVLSTNIVDKQEIWGMKHDCKYAIVENKRNSGVTDEVQLVIQPDTDVAGLTAGVHIMCWGKVQTIKDFNSGKVGVFVLVEHIEALQGDKWEEENEVLLIGELGRKITHRETPKGKRISDIMILEHGEVRGVKKSLCFIPCICWNEYADEVQNWNEGDTVEARGRIQSRTYNKQLPDGTTELRTAYEVSIKTIKKAEV